MRLVTSILLAATFVPVIASAAAPSAHERAAREAATRKIIQFVGGPDTKANRAELARQGQLFARQSVSKKGVVNVALRIKENGAFSKTAVLATWNAKTKRFSPLKMTLVEHPRELGDAKNFDRLMKIAHPIKF